MATEGSVLVSTHRLETAGRLREAFQEAGYQVQLVGDPDDLGRSSEALLLVLTGGLEKDSGEAFLQEAHRRDLAVFGLVSDPSGWRDRLRDRELDEVFGMPPDPDEIVFLARRTIQRRRLRELTGIVGETDAMVGVLDRIVQIAEVDSTVLITGESGTGKELVARGVHHLSPRRHHPFIAVNVAALSETLLESELFGHEKGAFTGAIDSRRGFFELAQKGTIFLDEIGEMPLATQTKLLRVLEQKEFVRVGGEKALRVDVRIIAATNQDLRHLVAVGDFRRDLYYRLNILNVELPPLRERQEDIPLLTQEFVREVSERLGRSFPGISDEAMAILVEYDWPGNVRELRNLVESMVVLRPGREIRPEDIPDEVRGGRDAVLLPTRVPQRRPAAREEERGADEIRPELEFIFRTLVDLRADLNDLRGEFDEYRRRLEAVEDEQEERPYLLTAVRSLGPGGSSGERDTRESLGTARSRALSESSGTAGEAEGEPADVVSPGAGEGRGPPSRETPAEVAGPEDAEREGPGLSEGDPDRVAAEAAATAEEEEGRVVYRPGMTMEDLEREAIRAVLREVEGNRRKAAERLGIGERTLYRKIRKYGLDG